MTDKQLLKVARDFRKGLLGKKPSAFTCAMVSWPLAGLLNYYGVGCRTVESDLGGMNHVWILLDDGRALDPTADQFWEHFRMQPKLPPVYLGPPLSIHAQEERPREEPPHLRHRQVNG